MGGISWGAIPWFSQCHRATSPSLCLPYLLFMGCWPHKGNAWASSAPGCRVSGGADLDQKKSAEWCDQPTKRLLIHAFISFRFWCSFSLRPERRLLNSLLQLISFKMRKYLVQITWRKPLALIVKVQFLTPVCHKSPVATCLIWALRFCPLFVCIGNFQNHFKSVAPMMYWPIFFVILRFSCFGILSVIQLSCNM